jgi:hypothetical protein
MQLNVKMWGKLKYFVTAGTDPIVFMKTLRAFETFHQ